MAIKQGNQVCECHSYHAPCLASALISLISISSNPWLWFPFMSSDTCGRWFLLLRLLLFWWWVESSDSLLLSVRELLFWDDERESSSSSSFWSSSSGLGSFLRPAGILFWTNCVIKELNGASTNRYKRYPKKNATRVNDKKYVICEGRERERWIVITNIICTHQNTNDSSKSCWELLIKHDSRDKSNRQDVR